MNNKVTISSELDAIEFLNKYLENPDSIDTSNIVFEGLDSFHIHLTGDKFHNSITPSVMKGIIALQHSLYEAFALAVYNDNNVNRLTKEQKQQLEIQVTVTEGSSILDIDINDLFTEIVKATVGKMNSTEAMVLVIFALVAYFGTSAWKHWADNIKALKEKELENEAQKNILDTMSETTKNALETLEKVAIQNDRARTIYNKSKDTKSEILKSTRYADDVDIDGIIEVTGEEAEYYTKTPKEDWLPVRMDGRYRLLEVNSSSTLIRKVRVRNLDTHREFTATLEDNTLDSQHLLKLGKAEWNHHPAYLEIKARIKGELIKDAVILSVKKVEEDIVFDDSQTVDDEN